jgi:CubicO group peptidase (beta-lactamase class C family)
MFKYLLILPIICNFVLSATTATEQRINQFLPKFMQYIEKNMPTWAIPGMAIVIVTPDKVLLSKGFGTREVRKNKPVNEHTLFQVASLTKNFTASLAGILEAKKFFSLQDSVRKYIPDFKLANKEASENATLQDLISHRMGIGSFAGDSLMKAGLSTKEIIEKINQIPFDSRFREDYTYSNQMFGFMGLVMEEVTHKSYEELLREYIYQPLGMTRSSAGHTLIKQENSLWNSVKRIFGFDENIALCHDKDLEGNAVCIDLDPLVYVFPSTSGINTSAHDFGIWLQCQLNNGKHNGVQIIPEEHINDMRKSVVKHTKIKPKDMQFPPELMKDVGYGMGWFMYDYGVGENTAHVFEHMGGYTGQRSFMFMCPSAGFAVGILTNLGHFNLNLFPEALRNVFLNFFLELEERDWSKEYLEKKDQTFKKIIAQRSNKKLQSPSPKKADKFYVGTYTNELYGEMKIEATENGLRLKIKDNSCKIVHWNADEFTLNGWEFNGNMSRTDPHFIEFGSDEKGQTLAYVSFLHEGSNPIFKKVS